MGARFTLPFESINLGAAGWNFLAVTPCERTEMTNAYDPPATLRSRWKTLSAGLAPQIRHGGREVQWILCALMLSFSLFAASGATYSPIVDFSMAHRLNADISRDPLAIIGTLASLFSLAVSLMAILQNRWRPTLLSISAIIFCLYSAASLSWGIFSWPALGETLKGILYIIAVPCAIQELGFRRSANIALATIFIILAVSIILCVTDARFSADGLITKRTKFDLHSFILGWRGLFIQKNWLAMFCLSSIMFFIFTYKQFVFNVFYWIALAMAVYLLIQSHGKTSESIALLTIFIFIFGNINRRTLNLDMKFVSLGIVAIFFVFAALSLSGVLFSRFDWTFTGRSGIWQEYWKLGMDAPYFGHGSGDVWKRDELFNEIRQNADGMTSAHNAFLGVFFTRGLAGLAIMIVWIFSICRSIITTTADAYSKFAAWLALSAALMCSMLEAMFSPNISTSISAYIIVFGLFYMNDRQIWIDRARARSRSRRATRRAG